jgi:predicted transcriptional regulator
MPRQSNRLNVVLDDEHSAKLRRLAERTHTNPGTIARSLRASALDHADPDARNISALLDAMPGAFERAQRGREEAREGLRTPLEDL